MQLAACGRVHITTATITSGSTRECEDGSGSMGHLAPHWSRTARLQPKKGEAAGLGSTTGIEIEHGSMIDRCPGS